MVCVARPSSSYTGMTCLHLMLPSHPISLCSTSTRFTDMRIELWLLRSQPLCVHQSDRRLTSALTLRRSRVNGSDLSSTRRLDLSMRKS